MCTPVSILFLGLYRIHALSDGTLSTPLAGTGCPISSDSPLPALLLKKSTVSEHTDSHHYENKVMSQTHCGGVTEASPTPGDAGPEVPPALLVSKEPH